jgi:hypothetical protein
MGTPQALPTIQMASPWTCRKLVFGPPQATESLPTEMRIPVSFLQCNMHVFSNSQSLKSILVALIKATAILGLIQAA